MAGPVIRPGHDQSEDATDARRMVDFRLRRRVALQRDAACIINPRSLSKSGETRGHFIMTQMRARAVAVLSERLKDFLLVSSFGFWAVLLGFFPVLAYHGLLGG